MCTPEMNKKKRQRQGLRTRVQMNITLNMLLLLIQRIIQLTQPAIGSVNSVTLKNSPVRCKVDRHTRKNLLFCQA